ncbi:MULTISPECIES: GapS4b family protein [unclassified Avibacterium]|uniref:GapS4b family protein n=1 Tax=unclassified Avibacterium TaxID=2685287 RepID=UPI0020268C83|nr:MULTISPECIES: hypothetical protein [unclassified Avibacterium]MCW9699108.1 hypothetical protein [Avibacterium sp. 20-129]URL06699.1 hypothetical protein L4F92_00800 [Avibacterium sp. 21-595]
MSGNIDLKGLIPSGNELRILLNSRHISDGEINTLLKEKGVFCGSGEKIISVPLLSAMLLTSDEYGKLIDDSISRSLKPKNKLSSLSLMSEGVDIIKPIKNLFSPSPNFSENIPNIEFIKKPNPVFEGNTIIIKYEIKRNDFSKDFLNRELNFSAEIIIENKGSELALDIASTHTSYETELINRRILDAITGMLKKNNIIQFEQEEKITFDAFEDIERVKFFKRLTAGYGKFLELDNVHEIVISREASNSPLPQDPEVSWMNDTVTSVTIDGKKLHSIFLISNEKYYEYYFIDSMTLTYKYTSSANSGTVKVSFFFSSPSKKRSSFDKNLELTFEVINTKYDNKTTVQSRIEIEKDILKNIRSLVKEQYKTIMEERS